MTASRSPSSGSARSSPGRDGIALLERATLPDGSPAFDGRELRHMADVRRLLGQALRLQLIVVGVLLALGIALRRSSRWRTVVPRGLQVGAFVTFGIALLAVPIILLGFDDFFVQFHSVFFSGDTWRFSTTDTLLRLYPEAFWQDTSQLAAGIVVAPGRRRRDRRDLVASPPSPGAERSVIDVRRDGQPYLRIGHRGAATLAPENTLDSFRAAIDVGVDLIEFDVLDLKGGPLVLAHSDHLDEVSHGAASGRVRSQSLEELREVAPNLPTFDEALAFFVDEAPEIGLHVDLKLKTRLDELAAALRRHGLEERTVISGFHVPSLRAVARAAPRVRVGITYPGRSPLDLPQAVPLADRLARALIDASVRRAAAAAARPARGGHGRHARAPPRHGVIGREMPRGGIACPDLDGRRAGRSYARRNWQG